LIELYLFNWMSAYKRTTDCLPSFSVVYVLMFDVVASDGVTLSNVAYGLMNKGCEDEGMTDETYKLCR
jgi:hypothetical protein